MTAPAEHDGRPPIWAGHIGPLEVNDLEGSVAFYRRLGLRPATVLETMASLEMRGGTHLVLKPAVGEIEPVDAPFDLMTDDLAATRQAMVSAGYKTSEIVPTGNHHRLTVVDPTGHRIHIHDSHVVGEV